LEKCASFGVQGMPIPKEYGGCGTDPITTIAMMEGLSYGGTDQGLLFSLMLTCGPIGFRCSNTERLNRRKNTFCDCATELSSAPTALANQLLDQIFFRCRPGSGNMGATMF
jgi:hypothetical protein